MKTNWIKIKQAYIEGTETQEELADKFKVNFGTLRNRASKENWTEQRKLFTHKVDTLRTEQKSIIMAGESVEFDSECLKAARAGLALVNKELGNLLKEAPEGLSGEDLMKWIFGRNDAITKYGKALNDYQKAGRLAFGENPEPDKPVTINVKYDK
ncbi:MAG: hypothetical protein PHI12_08785 [Dehalococcoidales bacterium]|nr:hypothetical protein [Dehalococcoidales bacterium]